MSSNNLGRSVIQSLSMEGWVGSFLSARPLLEHARRSPGPPSQANGTELWVLGADHNCQPTAAVQRSTAKGCLPDLPDLLSRLKLRSMWLFPARAARGSVTRFCRRTRQTVRRCLHRAWLGLQMARSSRNGSLPRAPSWAEQPADGGSEKAVAHKFVRTTGATAGLDAC